MVFLGAPTSAGAHAGGQEKAPDALRQTGFLEYLRSGGLDVVDDGNTPAWRWRPDPIHARAQNLDRVVASVNAVARRVHDIRSHDRMALVMGGDCTVEIGTVLGHLGHKGRVALLYFDMHADLNVPTSAPPGALDWMGVAHMLGSDGAAPALSRLGPDFPMLQPHQVLVFGHRRDQATAWELNEMMRLSVPSISLQEVADDPEGAAIRALSSFDDRVEAILVHFDVDVIDFTDAPLSENTGRNIGLTQRTALRALTKILRDPRITALTITELNPDHGDPDGSTLRSFSDGLANALLGRFV